MKPTNTSLEKKTAPLYPAPAAPAPVADYSAYAEAPAADRLAQLTVLASQQSDLESQIAVMETNLAKKREELKLLAEKTLPEAMDGLQMKEFTTQSGLCIKIAEAIRANIPKARTEEAIKWLDDNGFSNLVKRKFTIAFGKKEEKLARKFMRDLEQRKTKLNVDDDSGVHNKTLAAFVKEQLEEGKDIPMDLFGVFRQRYAKIEIKK